jgi:nucleoside-diphosphate-sugar epimerase
MAEPILITGSAGFIGTHLREVLTDARGGDRVSGLDLAACLAPGTFRADIRCANQLQAIASTARPSTIVHLAAKAEVLFPFDELGDLITTNVNGTINVLNAMQPERIVLASSSAVYGNATIRGTRARWSCIRPIGAYGMSKAAAELACADWARHTGGVAISLRFGNVVGSRCRGLVAYLVSHALANPSGEEPAQLRGGGGVVRDYVSIRYAASVIKAATEMTLPTGSSAIFNVGSGRGMTNRFVAEIVRRVLAAHGFKLRIDFAPSVAPGEAWRLVMDPDRTARKLGLPAPTEDEVVAAIEEGALSYLGRTH